MRARGNLRRRLQVGDGAGLADRVHAGGHELLGSFAVVQGESTRREIPSAGIKRDGGCRLSIGKECYLTGWMTCTGVTGDDDADLDLQSVGNIQRSGSKRTAAECAEISLAG